MNWNYPISNVEYFFVAIFLVLYVLYISRTLLAARGVGTTSRAVILKFFLRTIYFGLFIISLLGPFFGEPEKEVESEGKDIFLMVDVSKSMDATDIQPSRLEKVKYEIKQLTTALPENRYGLIVFSTEAFMQIPLTFDLDAFSLFLQTLSTSQTSGKGTDICSALELAIHKEIGNNGVNRTTKILLLMTDGENFGTCDRRLMTLIRQYGIKLVVVGVGTKKGITLKENGKMILDEDGDVALTNLDANFLQTMAKQANGSYFEINEKNNEMSSVIQTINGFENRLIDTRKVLVTSNKFRYFLVLGLILMVLDVLITVSTFQL